MRTRTSKTVCATVNLKAISKNVGMALLVSSLFMFISMCISIHDGFDSGFLPLTVGCIVTFIVGVFPFIFLSGSQNISLKDGFIIIILSWTLSFIFGMLPYVMWGGEISIVDAWFESVSGFTTTGATILNDVESLPRSLLFWRSSTHFIGGLGVVVFLLLILPSASPFRQRITKLEVSSLSKEGYRLQSRRMVFIITSVYLGLTLTSCLSYWACGMSFYDAINHAFSVVSTGGFSTKNASIAHFNSTAVTLVTTLFMFLAATNFALIYICIVRRSLRPLVGNPLMRFYFCSTVIMSIMVICSLYFNDSDTHGWGDAILSGLSMTVSYVTTTGFCMKDNTLWPSLACVVLFYASVQCGMAGSTTSGLKVDRMVVAFKAVKRQITSSLHPSNTSSIKIGGAFVPDEQLLPIILHMVLYFFVCCVSIAGLMMCGVDILESVAGTVASLSNVGASLGTISAAGNYDAIPAMGKFIYSLDMFLGRIEIYPLLVVVSLLFNRQK